MDPSIVESLKKDYGQDAIEKEKFIFDEYEIEEDFDFMYSTLIC